MEQFYTFREFAKNNSVLLKLFSIVVAVVVVETLLLLNTLFPTFGVLFYTINKSKKELLIFGLVSFYLPDIFKFGLLVYCDIDNRICFLSNDQLWI